MADRKQAKRMLQEYYVKHRKWVEEDAKDWRDGNLPDEPGKPYSAMGQYMTETNRMRKEYEPIMEKRRNKNPGFTLIPKRYRRRIKKNLEPYES